MLLWFCMKANLDEVNLKNGGQYLGIMSISLYFLVFAHPTVNGEQYLGIMSISLPFLVFAHPTVNNDCRFCGGVLLSNRLA
jgi:hypothetical protein